MRFMVMIKASPDTEMGVPPEDGLLLAMGKYNEELVNAGILVDGAGLMPTSKGARVQVKDGTALVTDGPFGEIKEVIAGFWIWNVPHCRRPSTGSRNAQSPTGKTGSKFASCLNWKTLPPKAKAMSSTRRWKPLWRPNKGRTDNGACHFGGRHINWL